MPSDRTGTGSVSSLRYVPRAGGFDQQPNAVGPAHDTVRIGAWQFRDHHDRVAVLVDLDDRLQRGRRDGGVGLPARAFGAPARCRTVRRKHRPHPSAGCSRTPCGPCRRRTETVWRFSPLNWWHGQAWPGQAGSRAAGRGRKLFDQTAQRADHPGDAIKAGDAETAGLGPGIGCGRRPRAARQRSARVR